MNHYLQMRTDNIFIFHKKNAMRKYFTIAALFFAYAAMAQNTKPAPIKLIWQRCFGGSMNDEMFVANPTIKGGQVVESYSWSSDGDLTSNYGSADWWVFDLDSNRNFVWSHSYGGSGYDKCRYIMQNPDGKTYMAFGTSHSKDHDIDVSQIPKGVKNVDQWWLLKLNDTGGIIWQKLFIGTELNGGRSILNTSDGGYLLCGWSTSDDYDFNANHGSYDSWLFKLDSNGNLQWKKNYGGSGSDRARVVIQTPNGGYAFTGGTYSNDGDFAGKGHGNNDFMVVKTGAGGKVLWANAYGGSKADNGYDISLDWDGNYLVTGNDSSTDGEVTGNHGAQDIWVIKVNAKNGALIWERSIGGKGYDNGLRTLSMPGHGYLVLGTSSSKDGDLQNAGAHGEGDIALFRLDSNRNLMWSKCFGGSLYEAANDMFIANQGYYIWGITKSNDGDVSGHHGTTNINDVWGLFVYDSSLTSGFGQVNTTAMQINNPGESEFNFDVYPTVTKQTIHLTATIYNSSDVTITLSDESGKVVQQKIILFQYHSMKTDLDVHGIPQGIYFVRMQSGSYSDVKKVVIQ
jgi:hypothetical protein